MFLDYQDKRSESLILNKDGRGCLSNKSDYIATNKLIRGDNLQVMKCLLYDFNFAETVDLVYIDPPFSTKNVFKISEGRANTISSSHSDLVAYSDVLTGSLFLEFLRERMILLRELMSKNASIYVHIDYKIGHYVKVIMDEVFGIDNFRNDITRIKCNPKNFSRKAYGNIKDLILFYTKTDSYEWHEPKINLSDEDLERLFKKTEVDGRRYTTVPLHAPGETKNGVTGQPWRGSAPPKGRHWRSDPKVLDELDANGLVEWSKNGVPRKKIYADDGEKAGKKLQDIWTFKDPQYPSYPTEKNSELLELIINTSSKEGDLVLDCFSGSGSTLLAASKLNRNWIGIDQSEHAIDVAKKHLKDASPNLFSAEQYEYLEWSEKVEPAKVQQHTTKVTNPFQPVSF
jgi:adenine-specific DNA-methyltransferase